MILQSSPSTVQIASTKRCDEKDAEEEEEKKKTMMIFSNFRHLIKITLT